MIREIKSIEEFDEIVEYNLETGEWNYKDDKPAIFDFYDKGCAPCAQMVPILKTLDEEFDDKFNIYKVCCSDLPKIASDFQIGSIPTLFFQTSNKKEVPDNKINPNIVELRSILNKLD